MICRRTLQKLLKWTEAVKLTSNQMLLLPLLVSLVIFLKNGKSFLAVLFKTVCVCARKWNKAMILKDFFGEVIITLPSCRALLSHQSHNVKIHSRLFFFFCQDVHSSVISGQTPPDMSDCPLPVREDFSEFVTEPPSLETQRQLVWHSVERLPPPRPNSPPLYLLIDTNHEIRLMLFIEIHALISEKLTGVSWISHFIRICSNTYWGLFWAETRRDTPSKFLWKSVW